VRGCEISSITAEDATAYFKEHSLFRGPFDLAICVREGEMIHGVIALRVDGSTCQKAHISTDGNAHIGSLLYGAAVRAAMALGYRSLVF
jgi:hypothetical protein